MCIYSTLKTVFGLTFAPQAVVMPKAELMRLVGKSRWRASEWIWLFL